MTFQRDGRLHALAQSVHVRQQIAAVVSRHLEPAIRAHLHGVGYQNGVLSLSLDSAAFSARLRYRTEDLSRKLRQYPEMRDLQKIRCVVRPAVSLKLKRTTLRSPKPISERTADMLHESAMNFSDSEIRESIQRLARLASGKKGQPDDAG